MERFSLNKLNEVEGEEQCRVEASNRIAGMEINSAWEMIRERERED
jgi:hypothetical protein